MSFFSIIVAFAFAAYLRARKVDLIAVLVSSMIVPIAVAIETFVYPAHPETQTWWLISIPVSFLYGLVSAGCGYAIAALIQKHGDA